MGEVAERSEDGEGNKAPGTLSVTFGDSSPKGGAKERQTERRRFFVAMLLRMTDKWGKGRTVVTVSKFICHMTFAKSC